MSAILEKDRQLLWDQVREQGHKSEGKQAPRNVWAAKALKPELTEQEWEAACRAVKNCAAAFDGMRRAFDSEPVDCGSTDYGAAARVSAVGELLHLKDKAFDAVRGRRRRHARDCVEWICRMWTLEAIAAAMGCFRSRGPARQREPDLRPVKPFVRLVLLSMAEHYASKPAEGQSMLELQVGIGQGWIRLADPSDWAAIARLKADGWQVVRTPSGAVFARDPTKESVFQPRQQEHYVPGACRTA